MAGDKIVFVEAIPNEVRAILPLLDGVLKCLLGSFVRRRGLKNTGCRIWFMRLIGERHSCGCLLCFLTLDVGRYDLKGLFEKAFGDFTVNVQGLSRVRPSGSLFILNNDVYLRCFL